MYVKLPPRDLNPDICPLHPTSTYTCGVTIAPGVCGGEWREIVKAKSIVWDWVNSIILLNTWEI